jgi:hypothetical protein
MMVLPESLCPKFHDHPKTNVTPAQSQALSRTKRDFAAVRFMLELNSMAARFFSRLRAIPEIKTVAK